MSFVVAVGLTIEPPDDRGLASRQGACGKLSQRRLRCPDPLRR
jgi:hypothetical protein